MRVTSGTVLPLAEYLYRVDSHVYNLSVDIEEDVWSCVFDLSLDDRYVWRSRVLTFEARFTTPVVGDTWVNIQSVLQRRVGLTYYDFYYVGGNAVIPSNVSRFRLSVECDYWLFPNVRLVAVLVTAPIEPSFAKAYWHIEQYRR